MNEIRNELINIRNYVLSNEEEKNVRLDMIFERFEIDLKRQKEELEYQIKSIDDNLDLLEYVKKQIKENEVK